VSGHAIRFPTKIDRRQKATLFRGHKGKFQIVPTTGWPYLGEPHNARGAAFGDLNNDGKIDVVISHLNEPVCILKNTAETTGRNWVSFRLEREKHHDIVGARLVLQSASGQQVRYSKGGGSYASSNDPRLFFGLNEDSHIEKATVYWPSGLVQELKIPSLNCEWLICENKQPVLVAHPATAKQYRP
jgi:enediyne biosynthesis protein E4